MAQNKIVRSVCYFTKTLSPSVFETVSQATGRLVEKGYEVQTKRICSPTTIPDLSGQVSDKSFLLSVGTLALEEARSQLADFYENDNLSFNIDLTNKTISLEHVQVLLAIIKNKPENTFNFTYVFNNAPSSPYFPAAAYYEDGYAIGLQPTDLSEGCNTLEEWFEKMRESWLEIYKLFENAPDFLGIDSSIAPVFSGKSSLIGIIKKLGLSFSESATTDIYLKITGFLKDNNPKAIGLCGLMFPCLEDFELAEEYENGNFSIERNIFLSLHSGVGIDTYPVAIDEEPARILEILKTVQALSSKYKKPLSARFVSDGKAKIGQMSNFQNQYLKDVILRKL